MHARRLGVCTLVLAVCWSVLFSSAAAAQDDPYGPTTTTTGVGSGDLIPSCELGLTVGLPGATGVVVVESVPPGGIVRVIIGGEEAGRATAPASSDGPGVLEVPFAIPELSPGHHLVTAVGADFTISCDTEDIEVLAASQTQGGSGSLPRTGIYVALFLVIALVLFLIGRAFLAASRARKRAVERYPSSPGTRQRTGVK